MSTPYDRYIADLQNAYNMAQLQLQRDRFNQIEIPTFQQVTLPTSYGGLTGMLPQDYRGPYAGLPTVDFLGNLINQRGTFTNDPRIPEALRGTNTLAREQVENAANAQQWRERTDVRDFNASRSDADRAFAETQRLGLTQQAEQDRKYALETNQDPRTVVGGNTLPDYLRPHAEWARNFWSQNGGRLPGYEDLVRALAQQGRVPEDYNPSGQGLPFQGQIPAAGPGILFDEARGGYFDTVSNKVVTGTELQGLIQNRQGQATPMRLDANGNPVYSPRPGVGVPGVGQDAAGGRGPTVGLYGGLVQGGPSLVAGGGNPLNAGLGSSTGLRGGPTAQGGPALVAGAGNPLNAGLDASLGRYTGGMNYGGSGATGAIGAGQPMSEYQRGLVEQGRATDIRAQLDQQRIQLENQQQGLQDKWTTNAQRITEQENLRQNAIAQGDLALRDRAEANINRLSEEKQALETEIQKGRLALDQEIQRGQLALQREQFDLNVGKVLGQYNGQRTLEAQGLYGGTIDAPTLAREELYGGSAMVPGGTSLAERQRQDTASLGYLNLLAGQRGPADIVQYAKVVGGTPLGLRDVVDASMGRFRNAQYGDYGAAPSPAGLTSPLDQASSSGEVANAMGRLGSPDQFSWQNVDRFAPTNRAMLTALSEGQGRRPEDLEAARNRVLGRYRGPTAGLVRR